MFTVIIVTYNSFDTLRKCLGEWLANPSCKIIIVDNASTDDCVEQIRNHYPAVTLLPQSLNLGYGRAANLALRDVGTPYALLLNPDIMARESDAQALVERMAVLGDNVALLAPAVKPGDYKRSGAIRRKWVIGAAMLFNMKALTKVGLFDDKFFLFSEETDLCHRINSMGMEIYLDTDRYIQHLSKQSSTPSAAIEHMKNWHFGWSRMYYHDKHGLDIGRRRKWRVIALYALKSVLARGDVQKNAYRAKLAGALAFCRGEAAFRSDGQPQQSPSHS